jgi:hypothetical protein
MASCKIPAASGVSTRPSGLPPSQGQPAPLSCCCCWSSCLPPGRFLPASFSPWPDRLRAESADSSGNGEEEGEEAEEEEEEEEADPLE